MFSSPSTTFISLGNGIKEVLHEFTEDEKATSYYTFVYFYGFVSGVHALANLVVAAALIKGYRSFKTRSFFMLIATIILANFLVIIVNCVCYIPVVYSWVNPKEYGSNVVYTYVSYLDLVADYINLFLSCTISFQRFLVFYYPRMEEILFRNSGRLVILSVIFLSVLLSIAHFATDCFIQFTTFGYTSKWEFLCGYSSGPILSTYGGLPNKTESTVAYILYLLIKSSVPLLTVFCYCLIFIKLYQLRNIAHQSHRSEYMQLAQSAIIFVMFQISTWFSLYIFNLEMTANEAFYAKRTVTMVDMGAATLPVIFLLVTNKEIISAMGLRKLSLRTTKVLPARVSAVIATATIQ